MKQSTRRNFLRSAGGFAAATFLSGCSAIEQRGGEIWRCSRKGAESLATKVNPPGYTSNASNELSTREFGDKYFNSRKSVVSINGKEYICMPLANYNVTIDDKTLAESEYLPFAVFERNKMLIRVNPIDKTINYGYEDNKAIIFVKDPSVKSVSTGLKAKLRPIGKKRVAHTSEPKFSVPLINFGIAGCTSVAYGEDVNNNRVLVLAPDTEYILNMKRGGIIQYLPLNGAFVEKIGKISLKPRAEKSSQPNPLEVTVERVNLPVEAEKPAEKAEAAKTE